MLPKLIAALSAVALLFPMLFFTFASPPLMILKHDTPQDARFIRGLFHHYYTVVAVAASICTLAQIAIGHFGLAVAMAGVAALAFSLHRWVIPRMDALRSGSTAATPPQSRSFGGCTSRACCSTSCRWPWWPGA